MQGEILSMAFDAGLMHPAQQRNELKEKAVERFAALVAAHTKEEIKRTSITILQDGEAAVLAEREACAKVCEELGEKGYVAEGCAAAIRARGNDAS